MLRKKKKQQQLNQAVLFFVLKPRANGDTNIKSNHFGCYMLPQIPHPVACC